MKSTQFIFVNGILNNPEKVDVWTDLAEEWIETNTPFKANKMEYRSGPITRRFKQNDRVYNLQKICMAYTGDKIVLVGHSNGCDIIQRLINKGLPKIHEAHLIAAASEHDFRKNGYNTALRLANVDKIYVYVSANDQALKNAKKTRPFLKYFGLGYGYLGLIGPKYISQDVADKVVVHTFNEYGHSDWFKEDNFEKTMKLISGG